MLAYNSSSGIHLFQTKNTPTKINLSDVLGEISNNPVEETLPTSVPKYLQLIYDEEELPQESLTSEDGYEIPRSSLRHPKTAYSNRPRPASFNHPYRNSNLMNRFPNLVRSNSATRSKTMPRLHPSITRSHSLVQNRNLLRSFQEGPETISASCTYSNIAQTQKPSLPVLSNIQRRSCNSLSLS